MTKWGLRHEAEPTTLNTIPFDFCIQRCSEIFEMCRTRDTRCSYCFGGDRNIFIACCIFWEHWTKTLPRVAFFVQHHDNCVPSTGSASWGHMFVGHMFGVTCETRFVVAVYCCCVYPSMRGRPTDQRVLRQISLRDFVSFESQCKAKRNVWATHYLAGDCICGVLSSDLFSSYISLPCRPAAILRECILIIAKFCHEYSSSVGWCIFYAEL